jgi:hypothetical protein
MKKIKAICYLLCLFCGEHAFAQTPTSDMFDGWGKQNWSIYFENDALNLGNLNGSDANYSQGLRVESLWDPGKTRSTPFRLLSLNLHANSEKVGIVIYNGHPTPASHNSFWLPLAIEKARIGEYVKNLPDDPLVGESYFIMNDHAKPKQVIHYSADNNHPVTVKYDPANELFVVSFVKPNQRIHRYTGWPRQIGSYPPTIQDLCIIQVLSHDSLKGSDLMVWFPAEFYENHRFYTHVDEDVTKGDYFSAPRLLDGALLPMNMFPNAPGKGHLPEADLLKVQAYEMTQNINREGVKVLTGYAIGQFIYTPTELVRNGPGDDIRQVRQTLGSAYRPVVGTLFVSVNSHSMRQNTGEFLFTEAKFGTWGRYSFAREVQGSWHGVIGYTDNPIYKYQLEPKVPFFFQLAANYRKEFVNSSYGLKIGYVGGADLGTLMANANAGFLVKVGHFEDQRYVKYSYKTKVAPNFLGRNFKFYGYAKPTVNVVAMNGLLSSTLFSSHQDDIEKLLPLNSINPVYLKMEAGIGLRIAENLTLNYTWVAQGPEYKGQPNNMYARVLIRVDY